MKCEQCPHYKWSHIGESYDMFEECQLQQKAFDEELGYCTLSNKYIFSDKANERVKYLRDKDLEDYGKSVKGGGYNDF